MKTLSDYTSDVVAIFNEYQKTGTIKWDYRIAMQDLPYQVGSLAKRVMQLENKRHKEGLSDEDIKGSIADELSDIFAEVLFIAHELEIDLDHSWNKMLESDNKKINERT